MKQIANSGCIRVVLFTPQPFIAQGVASVLAGNSGIELVGLSTSVPETLRCVKTARPEIVLLYACHGISTGELRAFRRVAPNCHIVLWGLEPNGDFVYQAMQIGVRALLPADSSIEHFLSALRNVHAGLLCFDSALVQRFTRERQVLLTPRQAQLVALVGCGLANKEIADALGVTTGTVKVYLYKLFRKLGVTNRLGLALYGLRNNFSGTPPSVRRRTRQTETALTPPVSLLAPPASPVTVVH